MTAPPPLITPEQARQFVADANAAFAPLVTAIGEGMARIVDAFAPIVEAVDRIDVDELRRKDPELADIVAEFQRRNDGGPTPTAGPPTSSPATMTHPDRSAVTVASSPQTVDKGGDNPGGQRGE